VPLKLVLAGRFDDIGAPLFGYSTPGNSYYQQWLAFMAALPADERKRVHYVGNHEPPELRGLYNAADAYASLSLHHDEDFGLSPAEALLCGTPVLLTDWGGYPTFLAHPRCHGVPVYIESSVGFASSDVQEGLLKLSAQAAASGEPQAREQLRSSFEPKLSIQGVSRRLNEIHAGSAPVFPGFSPLMEKLVVSRTFTLGAPFPLGPKKGTLYEEIYSSYRGQRSELA
jgi:glycosyltransferase involved in cell wall biosynthesis